jgi:hypothetical protein
MRESRRRRLSTRETPPRHIRFAGTPLFAVFGSRRLVPSWSAQRRLRRLGGTSGSCAPLTPCTGYFSHFSVGSECVVRASLTTWGWSAPVGRREAAVKSGLRLGRPQPAWIAAVALLAVALVPLALGGCGATATDKNEPNDDLNSAHALVPGAPADGAIGPDDSDVFSCDAPKGDVTHSFVVTVRTKTPQDIELQVGASIPGVWEGITWPGWKVVTKDDRVEVAGTLRKGTVLMFLKGSSGTTYSIDITWT